MTLLIAGLLLFLGVHSLRILAEPWRNDVIARIGVHRFRGVYSLLAIAGLWMLVQGYGTARWSSTALYHPPEWTHYLTIALMLPAMILFVATYLPGTRIKRFTGHPMMLGTRIWAGAHLLSNGRVADVLLFGSLFAWALFAHHAARARDRVAGASAPEVGPWSRDLIALSAAVVLWAAIILWLHQLIGVMPLLPPGMQLSF